MKLYQGHCCRKSQLLLTMTLSPIDNSPTVRRPEKFNPAENCTRPLHLCCVLSVCTSRFLLLLENWSLAAGARLFYLLHNG